MYCSVNYITCCYGFNNICCSSWLTLSSTSNVSFFNHYCMFLFSTLCCCSRSYTRKYYSLYLFVFFAFKNLFFSLSLYPQGQRFADSSFENSPFQKPEVLAFYVIQRTCMINILLIFVNL